MPVLFEIADQTELLELQPHIEFERNRRSVSPLQLCDNGSMLTFPTMMLADEPPPWRASAQPPLDISQWRSDGRLSTLVAQRFDMDNDEALRFGLACGGDPVATM